MRLGRLFRIGVVAFRHGLDDLALGHARLRPLRPLARTVLFWRDLSTPRAVRLRRALEDLGPIFIKFGQMLSTRRDLLPADIADELALLQDRVPPFASELVEAAVVRVFGKPVGRGVQVVRPGAGGERVGRPGAFRRIARRHAGRGQGAAPEHRGGDRARPRR